MITPRVATGALVRTGNRRILMLKRGPDAVNGAGEWSVPGGKLDPLETLMRGSARELEEEMGIVAVMRALGIITEDAHWGPDLHFVTHYFQATTWTGTARIMEPHKHDALQWVREEHLAEAANFKDPELPLFAPTRHFVLSGGLKTLK